MSVEEFWPKLQYTENVSDTARIIPCDRVGVILLISLRRHPYNGGVRLSVVFVNISINDYR